MSLTSLLTGSMLPDVILVRFEGEFPGFAEFYLEQLSELARIKSVKFLMLVEKADGIRAARDSLIVNSRGDYTLMVDDDVILHHNAFERIFKAVEKTGFDFSFICGNKRDVNNRRGYKDFSREPFIPAGTTEEWPTNAYYGLEGNALVRIIAADTGFILINRDFVLNNNIQFHTHEAHYNSGGEDTLFGMQCENAGNKGWFCPSAVAWHLEKPNPNFSQHEARCEVVLRTAETLKLTDGKSEFASMGWIKPNKKEQYAEETKDEQGSGTQV